MPNGIDSLNLKSIKDCQPGELIRAPLLQADWGIITRLSDNKDERHVVILDKVNGAVSFRDLHSVQDGCCLSYGNDYQLLPEYGGPCQVVNVGAPDFDAEALIYYRPVGQADVTTERYLKADAGYTLSLSDFIARRGALGGIRAAFRNWSIWMKLPSDPHRPTKIFQFEEIDAAA
jgi:hypothetical protein